MKKREGNQILKMGKHQQHTNPTSELVEQTVPSIKGLVLIGGKSTRMGTDKSQLNYHGKPQKEYVKEILENQGFETFYSVREGQQKDEIADAFSDIGPIGGICSAFQKDPDSAWFVLANDVPFVNEDLVKLLSEKRNSTKIATSVQGKGKQFPEPLVCIYEPKAFSVLLQLLDRGDLSPRNMLMNSDVEIVEVDDRLIRNINTPEEFETTRKELFK